MGKIKEPSVKCDFCEEVVPSRLSMRAKKHMITVDAEGKVQDHGAKTVCVDCMLARGMITREDYLSVLEGEQEGGN